MSIRTSPWPASVPCWADLTVPDVTAARDFYAAVLGWSYADTGDEFGGYSISHVDGAAAAGIGPLPDGGAPAWTLYFASDDADTTAAAVTEHGGNVLLPPGEIGELGRMFIAADPTGAVFGVWQALSHIGAGIANQPGGLTWDDLRSPDPDAARAFYTAVFGFQTEMLPDAGPDYATYSLAGENKPLGGMGGMMGAEGVPAHWVVYFAVADAAAAVTAAEESGGSVMMRDFDSPYGRLAGLVDPCGAPFWVIETDGSDQPDRSG